MLIYTRYRVSLLGGALFLGLAYGLMMLPQFRGAQYLIFGSLAFLILAWAYALSLHCPKCRTNLMLTSRDRIQSGKRHACTKCDADLRAI